MYKSPIEIAYGQLQTQIDGDVFRAVQSYNINVDKDELLKALAYDRDQYDKGYRDAMATIVHCKDCVYYKSDTDYCVSHNTGYCQFDGVIRGKKHYCAYAERKGEGE